MRWCIKCAGQSYVLSFLSATNVWWVFFVVVTCIRIYSTNKYCIRNNLHNSYETLELSKRDSVYKVKGVLSCGIVCVCVCVLKLHGR